jgi:AmmeMemoRadiSam system protein B
VDSLEKNMPHLRNPAVAGRFYPEDAEVLRSTIESYLRARRPLPYPPAALIVPHAGYHYSGSVAAAGYACLPPEQCRALRRVILLGTAHSGNAEGLIASRAEAFRTPLGDVPVDQSPVEQVLDLPQVVINDALHARDHSLEVQLPFLQVLLPDCSILPFLVGRVRACEVVEVLERLWRPEDSLIVVSSDLSHYHDADAARELDGRTAEAIVRREGAGLGPGQACGFRAIRGLLSFAGRQDWWAVLVDLKNSGDTAGPRNRVVGYGAFVFASRR